MRDFYRNVLHTKKTTRYMWRKNWYMRMNYVQIKKY